MLAIGGANWGVTPSDRAARWRRGRPHASALQWKRSFLPPEKPLWVCQLASEKEVKTSPANMELFTASTFGDVCLEVGCNLLTLYRECRLDSCGDSARRGSAWQAARRHLARSHQVTWRLAKDLFSCCWRTNSQISFYRAKGLYSRPIGGASEQNVFASPSNTNIIGWFYVSEALHAKNFGTRRRIRLHLKTDDIVKRSGTWFFNMSLFLTELTI